MTGLAALGGTHDTGMFHLVHQAACAVVADFVAALQRRCAGSVAPMTHIRYINPLPKNTAELLSRFKTVIVAELNTGQLASYLQSKIPNLNICHINKVQGQPFLVQEIVDGVKNIMMEEEL